MKAKFEDWKEVIYDLYGIGVTIDMLWHFLNIARLGSFYAQEPNDVILGVELLFFIGFLVIGLERTISDMMEVKK